MSTQYIASASVYTGGWINWTDGLIRGSTLTLSIQGGAYLIAFLALFVRVAGNAFWDLLKSAIFLARTTKSPKDGFFHQQQMLLRSESSDVGAVWQFLTLGRHWRHHTSRPWLRSLPMVLTTFFNVILFSAAGVFVSRLTSTHSDVLLKPTICGLWADPYAFSELSNPTAGNEWQSQNKQSLSIAGAYAASCYDFNSSRQAPSCNAYGRSTLKWSVTTDVQCPFASEMCSQGESVLLDSGLIDSHLQLGINAKVEDRIQYRQTLHCSPLETEGFSFKTSDLADPRIPDDSFENMAGNSTSFTPLGAQFVGFQYGANPGLYSNGVPNSNTTYVWNNYTFGISGSDIDTIVYLFDTELASLGAPDDTTFSPIPQLEQSDADLYIVFLINQVFYLGPVYDIWFQALVPALGENYGLSTGASNSTQYLSALPASPMGCIERYQWCKDEGSICTELTGSTVGGHSAALKAVPHKLDLNQRQVAVFNRIYSSMWNTGLYFIADEVTSNTLLANEQVAGPNVPALPKNQWILEADHWFGLALTAIQLQMVTYVLGDGRPSHNQYMKQVGGDSEWMCHNQIVQRDDFSSFSTLGIVLIFLLGGMLLFLDMSHSQLLSLWYLKIHPEKSWKLQAWRASRGLQVQSQAFEAQGLGTWDRTRGNVPITKSDEKFVNPFCAAMPEDIHLRPLRRQDHWWQRNSHRQDVEDDHETNVSHASFSHSVASSLLDKQSSFRPVEVELGKLAQSTTYQSRSEYQRLDTDNDGVIR